MAKELTVQRWTKRRMDSCIFIIILLPSVSRFIWALDSCYSMICCAAVIDGLIDQELISSSHIPRAPKNINNYLYIFRSLLIFFHFFLHALGMDSTWNLPYKISSNEDFLLRQWKLSNELEDENYWISAPVYKSFKKKIWDVRIKNKKWKSWNLLSGSRSPACPFSSISWSTDS